MMKKIIISHYININVLDHYSPALSQSCWKYIIRYSGAPSLSSLTSSRPLDREFIRLVELLHRRDPGAAQTRRSPDAGPPAQ